MTGLGLVGRGLLERLAGTVILVGFGMALFVGLAALGLVHLVSPRWVREALDDDDGDHGGYDHGLSLTRGLPYDHPIKERPCWRGWEERR